MISRRLFLKAAGVSVVLAEMQLTAASEAVKKRPNILLAISDDQSWPHTSAYGCKFVKTPAFDRVAKEGILFSNAFVAAPQCSPNRAALLTGRHIGSNREAGTHSSLFPRDLTIYPELLDKAGYHVGFTGKGWAPGNFRGAGWEHNPVGKEFSEIKLTPPAQGISDIDYTENFKAFLADREPNQPFCFWYGGAEPHRTYQKDVGVNKGGKDPATVTVPGYLPDTDEVRRDFLDYAYATEWFDTHLGRMLDMLEKAGELDSTLIVVTADNGMSFPHAKATLYDDGIHVPLAIRWLAEARGGRVVDDLISHIDLAPTFIEAAGIEVPAAMQGKSLMNILRLDQSGRMDLRRNFIIAGRERHTSARPDNVGYPSRALRTDRYLYIHNFKPDRYPLGDHCNDVDDGPSKTVVLRGTTDESLRHFYELNFAKRPEHELYDVINDRDCIKNLAYEPEYQQPREALWATLKTVLQEEKDPRVLGGGDIFESYPRFGAIRPLAGPDVKQGKYVKKFIQPGQNIPPQFLP